MRYSILVRKAHCGRHLNGKRRGTVVVLSAILMTVLVGMIAFAIDCGMIVEVRTQLQAAADAGARAGASSLKSGTSAAYSAAELFSESNSVAGTQVSIIRDQDVELGKWNKATRTFTPLTGTSQSSANAVRVTCRVSQARGNSLKLFFAPILGMSSADISAQAVAINSPIICGPFVGINGVTINGSYTDSFNSDDGSYGTGSIGNQGHVCSNATINLLGASTIVHGDAHPGPGCSVSGSGSATGSMTALTSPLVEPAIDPGNADCSNNNGKLPSSVIDKNGNFALKSKQNLNMPAGTYYFSSFKLGAQSTLTINSKVTIFCKGNFDAGGGTIANKTQLAANCQLYVMGSTLKLSGGSHFYGVVYAPGADITRSGNSNFFGVAVGKTLQSAGNGGLHYDEALGYLDGVPPVTQLVQ